MNDSVYQEIYNKLESILPDEWTKIIFRADYTPGRSNLKFYVDLGADKFVDCYNLPGISKGRLTQVLMGVDKIISQERLTLSGKNIWYVMTMSVGCNGEFEVNFDYTDISENRLSYYLQWEKKYLGEEC